jgi:hypothetical protein
VQWEHSLPFDALDGQRVEVAPGTYLIEPINKEKIRLAFRHEQGKITLQATRIRHDHNGEIPETYVFREDANEDRDHVVVLLPDGTALETTGSVSGIQTRGNSRASGPCQLDRTTDVIQFGDEHEGRRLPTRRSNIGAQYRDGSSAMGMNRT